MNVGPYRDLNGIFSILVLWEYLLMVKSNFDDLGVVGKLETRAITFILGHDVEKVIENLGFTMEIHKNPVPLGSKIQRYVSRKKLCSHPHRRLALKIIFNTPTLFFTCSRTKSRKTKNILMAQKLRSHIFEDF